MHAALCNMNAATHLQQRLLANGQVQQLVGLGFRHHMMLRYSHTCMQASPYDLTTAAHQEQLFLAVSGQY